MLFLILLLGALHHPTAAVPHTAANSRVGELVVSERSASASDGEGHPCRI